MGFFNITASGDTFFALEASETQLDVGLRCAVDVR